MSTKDFRKKRSRSFQNIHSEALKKVLTAQRYEQWMKRYLRNLLGRKNAQSEGEFSLLWEKSKPWIHNRTFVEVSSVIHRCTPSAWRVEIAMEPEDEFEGWLFVKK